MKMFHTGKHKYKVVKTTISEAPEGVMLFMLGYSTPPSPTLYIKMGNDKVLVSWFPIRSAHANILPCVQVKDISTSYIPNLPMYYYQVEL